MICFLHVSGKKFMKLHRKAAGEDDRNYYSGRLVQTLGLWTVRAPNLAILGLNPRQALFFSTFDFPCLFQAQRFDVKRAYNLANLGSILAFACFHYSPFCSLLSAPGTTQTLVRAFPSTFLILFFSASLACLSCVRYLLDTCCHFPFTYYFHMICIISIYFLQNSKNHKK